MGGGSGSFTLKKLECLKQAYRLNILHGIMRIGLLVYFIGLWIEVMINRNIGGISI